MCGEVVDWPVVKYFCPTFGVAFFMNTFSDRETLAGCAVSRRNEIPYKTREVTWRRAACFWTRTIRTVDLNIVFTQHSDYQFDTDITLGYPLMFLPDRVQARKVMFLRWLFVSIAVSDRISCSILMKQTSKMTCTYNFDKIQNGGCRTPLLYIFTHL